ncbi:response regulator transcription factor [Erysipelotrichaceae bacterium HCN-30851]
MEQIRIMIIEDDEVLGNQIQSFLQSWGYYPIQARNFQNILQEFQKTLPHLILMDINLPYYDGFYWCSKIRETSTVPIIYISSRNDDKDKIMAIAQGGDDYVEKPFHLELLKAKIEAILRRTYKYTVNHTIYLQSDLAYESHTSTLYHRNQKIELTKLENKVLSVLIEHRGVIVSRNQLMDALWNTNEFISDNTLNVLISRLRSKLKDICDDEVIYTKKGQGYYIQ